MIASSCLGALRGAPLRACLGALTRAAPLAATAAASAARAAAPWPARALSTDGSSSNGKHSAIYITDAEGNTVQEHTPLILGLLNYFERHLPFVGYFAPWAGSLNASTQHPIDRHIQLVRSVFEMKGDTRCAAAAAAAAAPARSRRRRGESPRLGGLTARGRGDVGVRRARGRYGWARTSRGRCSHAPSAGGIRQAV